LRRDTGQVVQAGADGSSDRPLTGDERGAVWPQEGANSVGVDALGHAEELDQLDRVCGGIERSAAHAQVRLETAADHRPTGMRRIEAAEQVVNGIAITVAVQRAVDRFK